MLDVLIMMQRRSHIKLEMQRGIRQISDGNRLAVYCISNRTAQFQNHRNRIHPINRRLLKIKKEV